MATTPSLELASAAPWYERYRLPLFAAVCAVCFLIGGGYAWRARASSAQRQPTRMEAPGDRTTLLAQPHVVVIDGAGDFLTGRQLGIVPLDQPDAAPVWLDLHCQRVYFAGGAGLCLAVGNGSGTVPHDGLAPGYNALLLDADLQVRATVPVQGDLASRARVSPDGRYGAMTFFVVGDSYAANSFSTRTTILDMQTGSIVANLEDFTVYRGSDVIRAPDFNFWGVTFGQDSNRFYATLGTGGTTYLVAGDITARTVRLLTENVECPSLSPDNTRIVFKRRVSSDPVTWRLEVLDLATMNVRPLAETRNVDDQAEWLDNSHVLYTPTGPHSDTWEAAVDGNEPPHLFAPGVFSPAVVR